MDQRNRCAKLLHPSSSDPAALSRLLAQNFRLPTATRQLLPEMTAGDQMVSSVEASGKFRFEIYSMLNSNLWVIYCIECFPKV